VGLVEHPVEATARGDNHCAHCIERSRGAGVKIHRIEVYAMLARVIDELDQELGVVSGSLRNPDVNGITCIRQREGREPPRGRRCICDEDDPRDRGCYFQRPFDHVVLSVFTATWGQQRAATVKRAINLR
jgi:hypothetical protein